MCRPQIVAELRVRMHLESNAARTQFQNSREVKMKSATQQRLFIWNICLVLALVVVAFLVIKSIVVRIHPSGDVAMEPTVTEVVTERSRLEEFIATNCPNSLLAVQYLNDARDTIRVLTAGGRTKSERANSAATAKEQLQRSRALCQPHK
jgi:hypothetical protein